MELIILKTLLILIIAVLIISIGPAIAILEQKRAELIEKAEDNKSTVGKELRPDFIQDLGRNGTCKSPQDLQRGDETPHQEADKFRDVARVSS